MAENAQRFKSIGTLLTVAGTISYVSAIFGGGRKKLIASNVLLFAGIILILGTKRFLMFLTHKKRIPGSIATVIGFVIILFNHPVYGGFIEFVGLMLMFNGFLPRILRVLQKLPYVGRLFNFKLPRSSQITQKNHCFPSNGVVY